MESSKKEEKTGYNKNQFLKNYRVNTNPIEIFYLFSASLII
jgi:hypothetical protein